MKRIIYGTGAFAIAATAAIALTSCQNDDLVNTSGHSARLSVRVGLSDDNTRTLLSEENGDLKCTWESADRIWVLNAEGRKLGELTLTEGAGTDHALFDGELTGLTDGNQKMTFVYFGRGVTPRPMQDTDGIYTYDFSNQEGTLASLSEQDMLYSSTEVSVDGASAYTEEMALRRYTSFAHFELVFPSGVARADEPVTISGPGVGNTMTLDITAPGHSIAEGAVTVGGSGNDLYVTILPNTIEPTFTVTIDGKTYSGTLAQRTWSASEFVRKGHGVGVPVNMTAESYDTPDDMVGPEIEINGKKYRFTRGNLKYNTATGVWTILDEQTYFVNAGGLGTQESLSVSPLGTTPEEIGLFGWGATGLEDARSPWYICKIIYAGGTAMEATGHYWPSTESTSKNSTIKNLWDNDFVYDWGRAYMENGRAADDNRQYVTPPQSAFITLFNNSFVQGCTIKGAGINGEDVTGLICIPGIGKEALAEAKAFINSVEGASCLSSMKNVIHNNTGNTLSYNNITLTGVDVLRKLNDAVFFPAASKRNLTSGKVYNSNGTGWYWTANGSTTNSYNLYFDGLKGGFLYSASNANCSMGRFNQMAVRLLVEVK